MNGNENNHIIIKVNPIHINGGPTQEIKVTHHEVMLRDESVQEILTTPPAKLIRLGNYLFLTLLLLLLLLSCIIPYPETTTLPITVVPRYPVVQISIPPSAKLQELTVKNQQVIQTGQAVYILRNAAHSSDVFLLRRFLDSISFNSKSFKQPSIQLPVMYLGELQSAYLTYQISYESFKTDLVNKAKFRQLLNSIEELKRAIATWDAKYVTRSSGAGVVVYQHCTQADMNAGKASLMIRPLHKEEYNIYATATDGDASRLKLNQVAYISLDNYPDHVYGTIQGKIKSLHWNDNTRRYQIAFSLQEGALSKPHVRINVSHTLYGKAVIVTKSMRLIQQLL